MAFNHQQYNDRYIQAAKEGSPPDNDAASYGVRITEANVADGETYWRIIGIHHLLPRENFSNHHVYIDALDENGQRIKNPNAFAGWTWEGRQGHERADPVPLDKPDWEAGANISMHFGQKLSVWIKGTHRDGNDKSDRAEGIHTAHPDEPLPDGSMLNTLGHHSFYVVFQRTTKKAAVTVTTGSISGKVQRGEDKSIRLIQNNRVVSRQQIGPTEQYRFDGLTMGTYRVDIPGTTLARHIRLDESNTDVTLNLALPLPTSSTIIGQIRNGAGRILILVRGRSIIARAPLSATGEFRFQNLGAGTYSVLVYNTNVRQDNIVLDGANTQTLNLALPDPTPKPQPEPDPKPEPKPDPDPDPNAGSQSSKIIDHYLLFGPMGIRGRQTNLLLATDYILKFSPTIGFDVDEAKRAKQVTIIGEGISQAQLQAIRSANSEVEVITGDAYDIEAVLTARILNGRAFG